MSTLVALIVAAVFSAALAVFLGLIRAYERRPKPEPSPWDGTPYGDWPAPVDLDDARERDR